MLYQVAYCCNSYPLRFELALFIRTAVYMHSYLWFVYLMQFPYNWVLGINLWDKLHSNCRLCLFIHGLLVFMCLSLIVLKFLWYKRNCLGLCLVDIDVDLTFTFAKVIQAFILVLLCFSNCWSVLLFRLVVITFVDFDNFYFRNFGYSYFDGFGIEFFVFYSRLRMWILVNWFGFRI